MLVTKIFKMLSLVKILGREELNSVFTFEFEGKDTYLNGNNTTECHTKTGPKA